MRERQTFPPGAAPPVVACRPGGGQPVRVGGQLLSLCGRGCALDWQPPFRSPQAVRVWPDAGDDRRHPGGQILPVTNARPSHPVRLPGVGAVSEPVGTAGDVCHKVTRLAFFAENDPRPGGPNAGPGRFWGLFDDAEGGWSGRADPVLPGIFLRLPVADRIGSFGG